MKKLLVTAAIAFGFGVFSMIFMVRCERFRSQCEVVQSCYWNNKRDIEHCYQLKEELCK